MDTGSWHTARQVFIENFINENGDIEMKRLFVVFLAFTLICMTLLGCSTTTNKGSEAPASDSSDTTLTDEGEIDGDEGEIGAVPAKTIDTNGKYTLSGDIDGQVLVRAENVTLILDGANITCAEGSAILGRDGNGDDVIQDLTIVLQGENTVTSGAEHGIQGKDDLTITGDGTVNISAIKDGIHAGGILTVEDGTINVLESYEGMEATNIVISGGTSTLNATDDGINAAVDEDDTVVPSILMTDGTLVVYCTGDGIDSNGSLDITGGIVAIFVGETRDGDAIDVDRNGGILPALFGSTQIGAGTTLSVDDLWSFTPTSNAVNFCLMIPGLVEGQSYQIAADNSTAVSVTATTAIQSMMGLGMGAGMGDGMVNNGGGRRAGQP
jgi:hypothetical protein